VRVENSRGRNWQWHDKETNYFYSAVTGTIKKSIQTTTVYIFCVMWVLTVSKNILIYNLKKFADGGIACTMSWAAGNGCVATGSGY
jgi:hypothetical protein